MTSPHPYGPHRDEDAPNAVVVLQRVGGWWQEVVQMIPPELQRQRAERNRIAHELAARHGS